MLPYRYQKSFGFSIVLFYVLWAVNLFNSQPSHGHLNGVWGTPLDHYFQSMERGEANAGDVLRKRHNNLILIFDVKRYFEMQPVEPTSGLIGVRGHLYRYLHRQDDWPGFLSKVRRPNTPEVTFALATKSTDNEAQKLAVRSYSGYRRGSSFGRMVRRMFSFCRKENRLRSRGTILKRGKLESFNGRPPLLYRIQIVDKHTIREADLFMDKHYPHGENLTESTACEPCEKNHGSRWLEYLRKGFSLAVFLEDTQGNRGPMIGCSVLDLVRKQPKKKNSFLHTITPIDPCSHYQIWRTVQEVQWNVDVFALCNCSSYVDGAGLAVDAAYQGRGIAQALLHARGEVCRMLGTPVSATVFTGAASQRAAEKNGYETISELDLRTFTIDGKLVYSNPKTPVLKFMAKRYY